MPKVTRQSKSRAAARDDSLPVRSFKTAAAWTAWLAQHHAASKGVWLRLTKKSAGRGHIEYAEVLDAALCFGWIDGLRKTNDERTFLQKFTPRSKRSVWSKINRAKALALIEAGRMHPAGLAEVKRAQADGRWDAAYDSYRSSAVPPDLAAALAVSPRAAAAFQALDSRNRYAILFRTQTAKRAETRARRIAQFIAMLARGERLYP